MLKIFLMAFFMVTSFASTQITLTESNHVYLNQPFSESSVANLMTDILDKHHSLEKGKPIYLVLYSPGGSIMAGRKLITFVNSLDREVHTISLFSASMAFHTVQNLGNRYIIDSGTLMTHKARGGFQGEFPGQLEARYYWIMSIIDKMNNTVVKRTKGSHTLKSYLDLHENEYWCDGQNCVEQGFVDDIAVVKCDSTLRGTVDRIVQTFFGSFVAKFSKCPLITAPVAFESQTNKHGKDSEKSRVASLEEMGLIYEKYKEFRFLP